MFQFINKIPKISLWVLFLTSVVIGVLFFAGGSQQIDIAGNMCNNPNFTDALIYWAYILFILAVVITLGIELALLILAFKNDYKKALKSLISVIGLVALFIIAWFLGDGETKLEIIGYEGTDNVGFWAQYSDMCIYLIYMFMGAAVLATLGSYIYIKVKNRK